MKMKLTEKQKLMKKGFADFAKSQLEPVAYEDDRNARFPEEVIKSAAEKNYFGLTIPKEYGGMDSEFTSVALMAEEFGKCNGSVAASIVAHIVMAEQTILKYGTEDQKKKYLPEMIKGNKFGAYAYVEPGASLGSGENKVVAVKKGNGYELTGKKTFVANGGAAGVYVVIAQDSQTEGKNSYSAFIVDSSDIKSVRNIDKLGLRSFPTAEVEFSNAKAQLLGQEHDGIKIAAEIQSRADIAFAAVGVGIAGAALEKTVDHSKLRVQFGSPIGRLQAVQWMLAEMASEMHTLDILTYNAVAEVENGSDYIKDAAYLKMFAHKAAFQIGTNAVQIHGGTGYSREAEIERYFRDLRGLFNFDGINNYPEKIIAGNLLK